MPGESAEMEQRDAVFLERGEGLDRSLALQSRVSVDQRGNARLWRAKLQVTLVFFARLRSLLSYGRLSLRERTRSFAERKTTLISRPILGILPVILQYINIDRLESQLR